MRFPYFLLATSLGAQVAALPTTWASAALRLEAHLPKSRLGVAFSMDPAEVHWLKLPELVGGKGCPDQPPRDGQARAVGVLLPWARLESLLREQKAHGEAWRILAEDVLRMSVPRSNYLRPLPSRGKQAVRTFTPLPLAEVWTQWMKVPDWASHVDLTAAEPGIEPMANLLPKSWEVRRFLPALVEGMVEGLVRDPEHPVLQKNLAALLPLLQPKDRDAWVPRLLEVRPLPGQPWPPENILRALWSAYHSTDGDHSTLMTVLLQLNAKPDSVFLPETWEAHHSWRLRRLILCGACDTFLRGPEHLLTWLDRLRELAGPGYQGWGKEMQQLSRPTLDRTLQDQITASLQRPPLPALPIPELRPALLAFQSPEDTEAFRPVLRTAPALSGWSPQELRLGPLPAVHQAPKRRWALVVEDKVVLEGEDLPVPETLREQLLRFRPSRLERAHEAVALGGTNPGPHRFRARLLERRMPHAYLEDFLAEDARLAHFVPELRPEAYQPNLWYQTALLAMPTLDTDLATWPQDARRWRAYAFWSTFRTILNGPLTLGNGLKAWEGDFPGLLNLRAEVHEAVGQELGRMGAAKERKLWFQAAWDALLARQGLLPFLEARLPGLLQGNLRSALSALGQQNEARVVDNQWKDLPQAYR